MLEPKNRRGHALTRLFESEKRFLLPLARQHKKVPGLRVVKSIQQRARLAGKLSRVYPSVRRDRERQQNSSHRAVDAGFVDEIPKHHSDK